MAKKCPKGKMKRRRNGEGSVSERKDGIFQASLMSRGKRKFEYALTMNEAYNDTIILSSIVYLVFLCLSVLLCVSRLYSILLPHF